MMSETLEQFKEDTLGKSLGNPKTNTYIGECVSYFRQGEERMFDIPTYPIGHAKDYWNNPVILKHFDQVSTPQNGDGVVYGATAKNPYGHIGWVYNGQLLSQNANIPKRVTIVGLDSVPNRLGYLRKKGQEDEMPNDGDATNYIRAERMDPNYKPSQAEINAAKKISYKDWTYRLAFPNDGDAVNYAKKYGGKPEDAKKFSQKTWAYRGLEDSGNVVILPPGTYKVN